MAKESKKGTLLKNTVMLYILTFSTYLFGFITIPYQTRVLGPEIYGILGFAQSCAIYIQLILDFGFILSATEDVAKHREDRRELSKILSGVLACKTVLAAAVLLFVAGVCVVVPKFRQDALLYILFFVYIFINSLLPDFLYRGLEKMSAITYRTVLVKLFFTVAVFIFLRNPGQYYAIPVLNACGALGACLWTYFDVYHRLGIRLVKVEPAYIWVTMKRSSGYFWSRIATTIYGATNSLIIGFVYPTGPTMGYYTASEKLMTTARSVFSPIADSLYPYMVRNRDYKLVKKILCVLMPVIILGCCVVGIYAEPFCALMFGEEYRQSGDMLRLLLPVVVISLPTYLLGFPMLSPMGLAKYVNISVLIGAIVHACQLGALYLLGLLTVKYVCIATCITEFLILFIRAFIAYRYRNNLRDQH